MNAPLHPELVPEVRQELRQAFKRPYRQTYLKTVMFDLWGHPWKLCIEYDAAPEERGTGYPGYLHILSVTAGDLDITQRLPVGMVEKLEDGLRKGDFE